MVKQMVGIISNQDVVTETILQQKETIQPFRKLYSRASNNLNLANTWLIVSFHPPCSQDIMCVSPDQGGE